MCMRLIFINLIKPICGWDILCLKFCMTINKSFLTSASEVIVYDIDILVEQTINLIHVTIMGSTNHLSNVLIRGLIMGRQLSENGFCKII